MVVLTLCPVLSLYILILSFNARLCNGVTNLKANLEMFEVRLHGPIVRPLTRVTYASRFRGIPVTRLWDCLPLSTPLKPCEAEDAECPQAGPEYSCSLLSACHQYPQLTVVLVT